MKKLKLDLSELQVQSFVALEREPRPGTVLGHEGTWGETCVTQCATGHCDCMLTVPPDIGC